MAKKETLTKRDSKPEEATDLETLELASNGDKTSLDKKAEKEEISEHDSKSLSKNDESSEHKRLSDTRLNKSDADQIDDGKEASSYSKTTDEEIPPPRPPRKTASKEIAEESGEENPLIRQLREAFPDAPETHLNAVLIASQGALDPAFNAMLYLSDPACGIEVPRKPVSKAAANRPQRQKLTQLEQDELLARQLDEKFNKGSRRRTHLSSQERRKRPEEQEDDDTWSQFVEKDLPEITAKAQESIRDTASKVGTWFSGVRKNYFVGEADHQDQDAYLHNDAVHDRDEIRLQPAKPERRRFNSFGAHIDDDDALESHGISLRNADLSDDDFDGALDEVPPQLPSRNSRDDAEIAQPALLETPKQQGKWKPQPTSTATPAPATPTKKIVSTESEDELFASDV